MLIGVLDRTLGNPWAFARQSNGPLSDPALAWARIVLLTESATPSLAQPIRGISTLPSRKLPP